MRRQVNWLVLAVTSLVVVAFVIPLALLVRRQAEDQAQAAAEQRAQSAAGALAVAVAASGGTLTTDVAEQALVTDAGIHLPDGSSVGLDPDAVEVVETALGGRTASGFDQEGNWVVALPVATPTGMAAVSSVADANEMREGVWPATAMLAGLGALLVTGSVLLADRLGRSLVMPVTKLASVADRLADGDLAVRAAEEGPPEIRSVAAGLNGLAARLGAIIEGEREALADLSHRLRTPLTALRLHAERAGGDETVLAQIDRTQAAVDQLIHDVRGRGQERRPESADLTIVVKRRLDFWLVLAENQGRTVDVDLPPEPVWLPVAASEITAALDALIGNVFAHTPPGTGFAVAVRTDGFPVVEVADQGPGFGPGRRVERGRSGAGSTGLGLDIARRLGERLGGGLDVDEGPGGGALIRIRLGA